MPTSSVTCLGPSIYNGPITLGVSVGNSAASGTISGTAAVTQTDNTVVSDPFALNVQDLQPVSGLVDVPSAVTAAPGQSVVVPWTLKNTSVNSYGSGVVGDTVVFTAPVNTTFPVQASVPAQFSSDDGATWGLSNIVVSGCTVSNAGHTLTCAAGYNNLSWDPTVLERFNPTVTVDAAAPAGAALTGGSGVFRYSPAGFSPTDITASLNINTPAANSVNTGTPANANPTAASLLPVPASALSDSGNQEALAYTGAGGVESLAIWAGIALLAGIVIAFMARSAKRRKSE
ncbi:hypothetical protein J7E83_01030 [Arthrobacter sp. ISL-48]|nr:hypothetical protein [Arthrobacter sp. ISL-48]